VPRFPAPPTLWPAQVDATAHAFLERLDDRVVVTGEAGHHLQRVRRVHEGELVTGADGWGRWRVYEVVGAPPGGLELEARTETAHEPHLVPALTVAFALTKGEKPELVVQKLTELGVDRIVLVAASRSVVRWDDAKAAASLDRLRRVAREAAQQCRRARLPEVDGPVEPAELAAHPGLVVAAPDGVAAPELRFPKGGEWLVAVGPEGGFDAEELARFGAAPRLAVGPLVLRAETAAIAVAAALAAHRDPDRDPDRAPMS
jgi:16S rRNA (uracil1498-N3)-methyltransferase